MENEVLNVDEIELQFKKRYNHNLNDFLTEFDNYDNDEKLKIVCYYLVFYELCRRYGGMNNMKELPYETTFKEYEDYFKNNVSLLELKKYYYIKDENNVYKMRIYNPYYSLYPDYKLTDIDNNKETNGVKHPPYHMSYFEFKFTINDNDELKYDSLKLHQVYDEPFTLISSVPSDIRKYIFKQIQYDRIIELEDIACELALTLNIMDHIKCSMES